MYLSYQGGRPRCHQTSRTQRDDASLSATGPVGRLSGPSACRSQPGSEKSVHDGHCPRRTPAPGYLGPVGGLERAHRAIALDGLAREPYSDLHRDDRCDPCRRHGSADSKGPPSNRSVRSMPSRAVRPVHVLGGPPDTRRSPSGVTTFPNGVTTFTCTSTSEASCLPMFAV